jgi:hypothetical protein
MEKLQRIIAHLAVIFAWFLIIQAISFPEYAICVSLDGFVRFRPFQTFCRPAAVLSIEFDPTKVSVEFARNDRCGTASKEWVEYEVIVSGTGKNKFRNQFFRLLRGMISIFRH